MLIRTLYIKESPSLLHEGGHVSEDERCVAGGAFSSARPAKHEAFSLAMRLEWSLRSC